MRRLSELDEIECQGLAPEKQGRERKPWEVAWKEFRTDAPNAELSDDGYFEAGFEAGQAHARAELQAAVREALPAEDPQGGEWWCRACGEIVSDDEHYHHNCGPVVRVEKENS